ncbi:hypothetical protein ACFOZ5_10310 [Marinobacter lacisalsi]|uniref:DM13 domain-containing protein n=1 Tax=Marinobacter lacisalsi TaxID=475979 RepID=A0ABV8QIJ5_9GAMM
MEVVVFFGEPVNVDFPGKFFDFGFQAIFPVNGFNLAGGFPGAGFPSFSEFFFFESVHSITSLDEKTKGHGVASANGQCAYLRGVVGTIQNQHFPDRVFIPEFFEPLAVEEGDSSFQITGIGEQLTADHLTGNIQLFANPRLFPEYRAVVYQCVVYLVLESKTGRVEVIGFRGETVFQQ